VLGAAVSPAGRKAIAALLEHHAPAAVLIDSTQRVRYFHGDTSPFLRAPEGVPTHDLRALVRAPLHAAVLACVRFAALRDGPTAVRASGLEIGGEGREVTVRARPLGAPGESGADLLVTFTIEPTRAAEGAPGRARELAELRAELASRGRELELVNRRALTAERALRRGGGAVPEAGTGAGADLVSRAALWPSIRGRERLAGLARAALAQRASEELVEIALRALADTLAAPLCALFDVGSGPGRVRMRAGIGWEKAGIGEERRGREGSCFGCALSAPGVVLCGDCAERDRPDSGPFLADAGARSVVMVALERVRPAAALAVASTARNAFGTGAAQYVEAVAGVLALALDRASIEERVAGLRRDWEARREEHERRARLLREVATVAAVAAGSHDAFEATLGMICRHHGWLAAHAFTPDAGDPTRFAAGGVWWAQSRERFGPLARACAEGGGGGGALAAALATGRPQWGSEPVELLGEQHLDALRKAGVGAVLLLPIAPRGRVGAMLAFFAARLPEQPDEMVEQTAKIGDLLGRAVEREQWTGELRTNEERFRRVLEHSPVTVAALDSDLLHTWVWNRPWGRSENDVLGRSADQFLDPASAGTLMALQRRVLEQGVAERVELRVASDAEKRIYDVSIAPERDAWGRTVGLTTTATDISERRRLEAELLEAGERERQHLGQELHDGIGQELTGVASLLQALEARLVKRSVPEAEVVSECVAHLQAARGQLRRVARGLHPVDIGARGLLSALQELATATDRIEGVECRLHTAGDVEVNDIGAASDLFHIVREALGNALRHAAPSRIELRLEGSERRLRLAVLDDGRGITETAGSATGQGMKTMRYRAQRIGGVLNVAPRAEGGTAVSCQIERKVQDVAGDR